MKQGPDFPSQGPDILSQRTLTVMEYISQDQFVDTQKKLVSYAVELDRENMLQIDAQKITALLLHTKRLDLDYNRTVLLKIVQTMLEDRHTTFEDCLKILLDLTPSHKATNPNIQ